MKKKLREKPLKLVGFNNLTKALSFNLYDFSIARNESERCSYRKYVQEHYHATRITNILKKLCTIMDAKILTLSQQDYDPWGASSMLLVSDIKGSLYPPYPSSQCVAAHLDKSHICAHTYPDFVENGDICSFRIDIDIATCGEISPLRTLNEIFASFDCDVVVIDYVVRGFTRDHNGCRIYIDHEMSRIQDYIDPEIKKNYRIVDLALNSENIWQTKMMRVHLDIPSYFRDPVNSEHPQNRHYINLVRSEMRQVFYMWADA